MVYILKEELYLRKRNYGSIVLWLLGYKTGIRILVTSTIGPPTGLGAV